MIVVQKVYGNRIWTVPINNLKVDTLIKRTERVSVANARKPCGEELMVKK